MVDLRNLVGPDLKELQRQIKAVKNTIVILGVQYVGSNWYVHFLVQDTWNQNEETKKELGLSAGTTALLPKKKGK